MKRRGFLGVVGSAVAAWPILAQTQQSTTLVVGLIRSTSRSPFENLVNAFRRGLNEAGFVEGQNLTIEYRYGDDQSDRLQTLIAELIRRPVAVIVANNASALVAVSKTTTVPIVFVTGGDPVRDGLVANFNRPGGNVTGVVFFSSFWDRRGLSFCGSSYQQRPKLRC
jgi:putative ABC transport system substrate-binding protein